MDKSGLMPKEKVADAEFEEEEQKFGERGGRGRGRGRGGRGRGGRGGRRFDDDEDDEAKEQRRLKKKGLPKGEFEDASDDEDKGPNDTADLYSKPKIGGGRQVQGKKAKKQQVDDEDEEFPYLS